MATTRAADYQVLLEAPLMDTPQVLLEHHLKQLRLPTFLREYAEVAEQCAAEGVTFPRSLLRLIELELLDRERRATERRIKSAKFPVVKSLDTFDFLAIPTLNKSLVLDLARCEFIGRQENVLALGKLGHRQNAHRLALGLAACQKGFRVRFTTAASLVHELIEARDEKRLMRFQKKLLQPRAADRRRTGIRAAVQDRRRTAVRGLQPALRTRLHAGHQQPAVQRMDRSARIGAADRRPAGPAHPPRPHPGDERRKLPAEKQRKKDVPASSPLQDSRRFGGGFRSALTTPPYGRRRAPLQPPQTRESPPERTAVSGPLLLRPGGNLSLRP